MNTDSNPQSVEGTGHVEDTLHLQLFPTSSRPEMSEYGLLTADEGKGLLPWRWALERLNRAPRYWLTTTRPNGRPHCVAVWGVWLESMFYFSTGRLSRKARNLSEQPHCVVCTEDAAEAVIVEGSVRLVEEPSRLAHLVEIYQAKYHESFPPESNVYAVRPQVAFGFIEAASEFTATATRWKFS
ncbi:MAG: pyridoxamine 5'-phosphate oxidase family protein [Anaerolineales bacterium]